MEQTALALLKDAHPEEFYLITVDMAKGVATKMLTGLNEKKVREHFAKQGLPESEIDNRIAAVRKKPVGLNPDLRRSQAVAVQNKTASAAAVSGWRNGF